MSSIRIAFFQLLQVAIGNRNEMSSVLTDAEWDALYAVCKEQAVHGIGYAGAIRLPKNQRPRAEMMSMWQWVAQNVAAKNADVSRKCIRVCGRLAKEGFGVCILKGQSNLPNYPEYLRPYRNSGDIDVWMWSLDGNVTEPVRKIIEYCDGKCGGGKILYHHIDMDSVGETPVEAHYRINWLSSPFRNSRLQKWSVENRATEIAAVESSLGGENRTDTFPVPTLGFNVIYQLVHIYRHLYEAGIGIRQLIDYYFVLREYLLSVNGKDEAMNGALPSRSSVMQTLRGLGLDRFAGAVMYVLREALDMPDGMLLCPVDEVRGRILLDEIMTTGNFGCADGGAELHDHGSHVQKFLHKVKRSWQLGRYYPHEALWLPLFTIAHWTWRRFRLWRY